MVHDLREVLRVAQGRAPQPTAAIFDGRTVQSTPDTKSSRRRYIAVDTLGHLLAVHVTPADEQERAQVAELVAQVAELVAQVAELVAQVAELVAQVAELVAQVAELVAQVQEATDQNATLAYVDQGCTGEEPAEAAKARGIALEVVKLREAKKGFVPRRWVVERSFAWAARFRRLARDYERLPETLAGLHYVVSALLMLFLPS